MKENVRLGRIAGIAVGFNWTLLLIAAFLAFGLGGNRFPIDAPGYSQTAYTLAGVFTALAFLAGVLAHEMSHALVARREGLKVDGIVLWLMGGYTRISEEPKTPGQEFRISGVGPLVSLLIGLGSGVVAVLGRGLGVPRLAISVLTWLAMINVLLALFNVLPGSPLDGGRIVHAAVWWKTGDKYRATRVASGAGGLIGLGLLGLGVLSLLGGFSGGDGLWLAVVGGFLLMASRAEGGASAVLEKLDGLRAADLMAQPGVGPGWLTVDAFLREYASGIDFTARPGGIDFTARPGGIDFTARPGGFGDDQPGAPWAMPGSAARGPIVTPGFGGPVSARLRPNAFLVEQWGGGLAGLTPTAAMEAVPPALRFQARAVDYAVPVASLPVFAPDVPAGEVVGQMNEQRAAWALVVESGQILGVVCLADVALAAQRAKAQRGAGGAAVDSSSWSLTRG